MGQLTGCAGVPYRQAGTALHPYHPGCENLSEKVVFTLNKTKLLWGEGLRQ